MKSLPLTLVTLLFCFASFCKVEAQNNSKLYGTWNLQTNLQSDAFSITINKDLTLAMFYPNKNYGGQGTWAVAQNLILLSVTWQNGYYQPMSYFFSVNESQLNMWTADGMVQMSFRKGSTSNNNSNTAVNQEAPYYSYLSPEMNALIPKTSKGGGQLSSNPKVNTYLCTIEFFIGKLLSASEWNELVRLTENALKQNPVQMSNYMTYLNSYGNYLYNYDLQPDQGNQFQHDMMYKAMGPQDRFTAAEKAYSKRSEATYKSPEEMSEAEYNAYLERKTRKAKNSLEQTRTMSSLYNMQSNYGSKMGMIMDNMYSSDYEWTW